MMYRKICVICVICELYSGLTRSDMALYTIAKNTDAGRMARSLYSSISSIVETSVEQLVDEHGRIVRSAAAYAALRERVEQHLSPLVCALTIEEQAWSSSSGVHMAGIWCATQTPLIIKLGINKNQLYWTQQIAAIEPDLMPRLYASGDCIGEISICWTAMERIAFGPLGPAWNGEEFTMLLDAAVRFQRAARAVEPSL